jgi:anaerobic magnesium-protoporphyrin IX monomethyl ester cyclase
MKILLLTTPWRHEEIAAGFMGEKGGFLKRFLSRPGQKILGVTPTLGLLYIAAVLKQAGHQVDVLDGYFIDFEGITSFIEKGEHKLIGIYSYTVGWENDKRIITLLKDRFPDKIIVAGGPHPILWKENCLKECEALDIVVCGEGEYIMQELCSTLESKGSLNEVAGIIWRGEEGVKVNSPRPYVEDLNKVPFPDRSLVAFNKYIPTISNYKRLPSGTMMASRGCPYFCTFCQAIRNVRFRNPENVLDELEELVNKYGIRDVTFYDETFTLNRENVLKISEGMTERKLDLTWAANARPQGLDEMLLRKMKESGCWRLLFGIE